jgi:hypothetical protein
MDKLVDPVVFDRYAAVYYPLVSLIQGGNQPYKN